MNSDSDLIIKDFERWLAHAKRPRLHNGNYCLCDHCERSREQSRWEYNTVQNALNIVRYRRDSNEP